MYSIYVTVNKANTEIDLPTITVDFDMLNRTFKELIENNLDATSFIFVVARVP